jgi:phage shock protein A
MAITKRIIQVFKADIHGVLDYLEEPEAMLKQAIRDMEEELAQEESRREEIQEQYGKLQRSRKLCEEQRHEAEKQIDLCFESRNETLARTFIRRRLECEQRMQHLAAQAERIQTELSDLERKLDKRQEKLAAVKEKMDIFCKTRPQSSGSCTKADDFFISEEQVEVALLEEKRRRENRESQQENI